MDQYLKNGIHGSCTLLRRCIYMRNAVANDSAVNWYRTREINFQEELQHACTLVA